MDHVRSLVILWWQIAIDLYSGTIGGLCWEKDLLLPQSNIDDHVLCVLCICPFQGWPPRLPIDRERQLRYEVPCPRTQCIDSNGTRTSNIYIMSPVFYPLCHMHQSLAKDTAHWRRRDSNQQHLDHESCVLSAVPHAPVLAKGHNTLAATGLEPTTFRSWFLCSISCATRTSLFFSQRHCEHNSLIHFWWYNLPISLHNLFTEIQCDIRLFLAWFQSSSLLHVSAVAPTVVFFW